MPLLDVSALVAGYGVAAVLDSVSFAVEPGEIVALLGANGAGKTTTLRAVSGLLPPRGGSVRFAGSDITGAVPREIVRLGIAHVPEGRRVFPGLSVRENLQLGAVGRGALPRRALAEAVAEMLGAFPALAPIADAAGWTLSGGQQQMVALARGLMAAPRLLLLDEPSLGLAPRIIDEVAAALTAVRRRGAAVLLVEQNAAMALAVADRGYVLDGGRVVLAGPPEALRASPAVQAAELGDATE
jgi:branched-chain amino acid transport system ATP-binding protein